jgi:tRNA pseudouridine55 synthase
MGAQAQRKRPARRDVHGIVLLDKPEGLSSNQALQRVRGIYRARKAGHTGSLDPAATGLLPLCFGEATKVSAWLLDAEKEYLVRASLGERRDTGDSEGSVVETAEPPALDAEGWQALFRRFTGDIEQVPPMYSALKKDGRRLYELAREGREVEREPRAVRIASLQLIAVESDELVFRVRCSKGTYIRTLVEDMASAAGSVAYTRALRRVAVGPFRSAAMVTLEALEKAGEEALEAWLQPVDAALADWPAAEVDGAAAERFLQGQQVPADYAARGGHLRVYDGAGRFLGVGEIPFPGAVRPRRVFVHGGKSAEI